MASPQLDFYAPAPDHRLMNKGKLGRQRDGMFSWRKDHQRTAFDPKTGARKPIPNSYEMAAKQIILPGSEREVEIGKKKKQREETIWDFASGTPSDRRREWRATGFTFDDEHFRTSEDPLSPYYPRNRPRMTAASLRAKQRAILERPYVPYFHDTIQLSCPPRGAEVTCLAVTCNKEEAIQRELHASKVARQARLMGQSNPSEDVPPSSWCEALGPAISSKQRNMELAQTLYHDLICRQAALTETEVGSPESLDVQIPTSEIAYSLRSSYLEHHRLNHPRTAPPRRRDPSASKGSSSAGYTEEELDFSSHHPAPSGTETEVESQNTETPGLTLGNGVKKAPGGARQHLLPAEAKGTRLYAIQLQRHFNNEESSMTRRQEPLRQGVAVDLPPSWQSPLLNNS